MSKTIKIKLRLIKLINLYNVKSYMKKYVKCLIKLGVDIKNGEYDKLSYYDPSAYFDGAAYKRIHIGNCVTISKDVIILVHDYSISRGMKYADPNYSTDKRYRFIKDVIIEDDCFIGARSILLPGTTIGKGCIIGAGSVVRGKIPEGSIVAGNPGKIISSVKEWGSRHYEKKDYEIY